MIKETKRELILDAAIKVFAQRGYYGSRVSDITEVTVTSTESLCEEIRAGRLKAKAPSLKNQKI